MEGPPKGSQHKVAIHRSRAEATRLLRLHDTDDYSSLTTPAATTPVLCSQACRTDYAALEDEQCDSIRLSRVAYP
jgi:hypothetical protein